MKLRTKNSTQPQIFDGGYKHPWYEHKLNKPNPPTQQAVEQAKFVDKTYQRNPGGDSSVRPRNKRSTK